MGHGDHWNCVSRDVEAAVTRFLPLTTQHGEPIAGSTRILPFRMDDDGNTVEGEFEGRSIGLVHTDGPVRTLAVLVPDSRGESTHVWTVYPFAKAGIEHRLKIAEIHEWENRVEAEITAETEDGYLITFFDVFYFQNAPLYDIGKTYTFRLGALAYDMQVAEERSFEISDPESVRVLREARREVGADGGESENGPIEVHTRGMAALFPIEDWDPSDFSFHGPTKKVLTTPLDGQNFFELVTTVLRGEKDFDIPILAADHVLEGGQPTVGDDVTGAIWIHGHLIDDETAE